MIDLYGFHTRDISLPESEDRYEERSIHEVDSFVPSRELSVCKNCGEPLRFIPSISTPCLQWIHAHGYYGCNKGRPCTSETYAEPYVITPSLENLRWRQRLADSLKKEVL